MIERGGKSGSGSPETNTPPHTDLGCIHAFGMVCLPGDEPGIHVEVIMDIDRVENSDGSRMIVEALVSDVEPFAGALDSGRWEKDHSVKARQRLFDAVGRDGLRMWTGRWYEGGEWTLVEVRAKASASMQKAYAITLSFTGVKP